MSTLLNSGAPIEESFGPHSTAVYVWPDGIEGCQGEPFGILTTADLYSEAAVEAQQMEAHMRGTTWLQVRAEWEAEQDAATMWLHARGLGVWWDSPLEEAAGCPGGGRAIRSFAIAAIAE